MTDEIKDIDVIKQIQDLATTLTLQRMHVCDKLTNTAKECVAAAKIIILESKIEILE